jgi:predicted nucleic acid-binding protein
VPTLRSVAFVEAIIQAIPAFGVTTEVARVHARLLALIEPGLTIAAHDVIIAATAVAHGHAILTRNVEDFSRIPSATVIPLSRPPPDPG